MNRPGTSGPGRAGRADAPALTSRADQGRCGPVADIHLKSIDIMENRVRAGQGRPMNQGVMWTGPREGEGKPPLGGSPPRPGHAQPEIAGPMGADRRRVLPGRPCTRVIRTPVCGGYLLIFQNVKGLLLLGFPWGPGRSSRAASLARRISGCAANQIDGGLGYRSATCSGDAVTRPRRPAIWPAFDQAELQ